jgi:hypothetical protein
MNLHDGAVQRHRLDLDTHDLGLLKLGKHAIQHAALGPSVHARVDGMPVAEALGQAAPFASVLCNVKDRIQHAQIRETYIAALQRQAVLDLGELGLCDLHV